MDFVEVDGDDDIELLAPMPTSAPTATIAKRDGVFTTQTTPVTELRVISQPTTVPDVGSVQNYVYDDKAGSGIYMYMVEDGINTAADVRRVHPSWHCARLEAPTDQQ